MSLSCIKIIKNKSKIEVQVMEVITDHIPLLNALLFSIYTVLQFSTGIRYTV